MIKQERRFPSTDRECLGWPTDVRLRALEVIATTRCEWLSRGAADAPVADRARIAHPMLRLALEASPEP